MNNSQDNPYVLVLNAQDFMAIHEFADTFKTVSPEPGATETLLQAVKEADARHACKDEDEAEQHCYLVTTKAVTQNSKLF